MSSNIDTSIPPLGNATTAGVRNNFSAAKTEIEALQQQIGFKASDGEKLAKKLK